MIVVIALMPGLMILCWGAFEERRRASREIEVNIERMVNLTVAHQERLVESVRQLLTSLAGLEEVRRRQGAACSRFFADLIRKYPSYANLGATDDKGDIFCSAVPADKIFNAGDRSWYQRAMEEKDFVAGDFQIGRITKKATINFGQPVMDETGRIRGVVFAAVDLSVISRLAAKAKLPPGATLTIFDRRGASIARFPRSHQWMGRRAPEALSIKQALRMGREQFEISDIDGVDHFYAFGGIRGASDVYVSISMDKSLPMEQINRWLMRNLGFLLLTTLAALILAGVGAEALILRKVQVIIDAAQRIRRGDFSARTGFAHGPGDINHLAAVFDQMAAALESRDRAMRQAQAHLIQSEKMATIGQLSSGIAHEINNPLAGIMGILQIILAEGAVSGQLKEDLDVVLRETQRIKRIVSDMLVFSRNYDLQPEAVDVGDVMREIVVFMKHQAKINQVSIENMVPRHLDTIESSAAELRQIFMNVILNAIQAMPDGGTLTISHETGPEFLTVKFKDTGHGIDSRHVARVFDPFFTTKASGQGTGLGLSVCLGIARNMGGRITVESEGPGKGALFSVSLPSKLKGGRPSQGLNEGAAQGKES